ncbi:MAG: hypothetical protein ACK484_11415 [Sphingobacteriales bacterium]|jgi:hypothetical protein
MLKVTRQMILWSMMVCVVISCSSSKHSSGSNQNHIWTFTYLKAKENQKENLKAFLEKNWFVMDSIAVKQKILGQYELYENKETNNPEWDYIVADEYLSPGGYDDIAPKFEAIRAKHVTVKINGMDFRDLGKVIKTETLTKPFP